MASRILFDRRLALSHRPIFYQEWKDLRDFPTKILLGKPGPILDNLAESMKTPALYYSIREDEKFLYFYYLLYHPFDWSSSKVKFIKKLDSHQHDTEAVALRVHKGRRKLRFIIATMNHHRFIFRETFSRRVVVRTESHAIFPIEDRPPTGNYLAYQTFSKYVDFNSYTKADWKALREGMPGRALPQDQKDAVLSMGSSGRRHNKPGDIFSRPERFFRSAERKGFIRCES